MGTLLDIKIDSLGKEEISQEIENFLREDKFHQIATINPEFILEAQKNSSFKEIINHCDLGVADGIGIQFAYLWLGKKLKIRMAGVDLMLRILKISNRKGLKVFLAANKDGLSSWEEVAEAILKIYPDLKIEGQNLDKNITNYNLQTTAQVVFCNFGAPYQEMFLSSIKNDIIRLAMGVGGSFDFLTGKLKRAPEWMQFFGIEWIWRLILQPRRWKRIWNAVIIFPIKVIFNK